MNHNIVYGECGKHPGNNMVNCSMCKIENAKPITMNTDVREGIITGNKIIAEFMGMKLHIDNKSYTTEYEWLPHPDFSNWLSEEPPPFGNDWRWLMPVVEKIELLHMDFQINADNTSVLWNGAEDEGYPFLETFEGVYNCWDTEWCKQATPTAESKINGVWNTCVEFIQWLNKQKH